jgi:predicted Rossmann-fold nucleotide-binding protein
MLVWTLLQTGQVSSRPFLFLGESWRRLFQAIRTETFVREADLALLSFVDDAQQAVAVLSGTLSPTP